MGRTIPTPPDAPPPDAKPVARTATARPPRWTTVCVVLGVVLVALSAGVLVTGHAIVGRYEKSVHRGDLFGDAERAAVTVEGPLTFLIIGSDSRAGDNYDPNTPDGNAHAVQGARSDTIMLVRVPKSMDTAYVISLPRDSYVPIAHKKGDGVGGRDKINAAFANGGAARLVKTVQAFTGVGIDYPVVVDFAAVRTITDLVGGVDVFVTKAVYDEYRYMPANTRYPTRPCIHKTHGTRQRCLLFPKGPLHLNGELAQYYVRQRTGLPGGDLDRVKRQQQFLRALVAKAASGDQLTNPKKFDTLVRTVAGALTVDQHIPSGHLMDLAWALKGLRTEDLVFMTLPIGGSGTVWPAGSVLYPDMKQAAELFTALKNDTLDQYVARYPPNDVTQGA